MQNHNEIIQNNTAMPQQAESHNEIKQAKEGIGLLPLVHEVKHLLETKHNKKIEDLEYQLLEKEDIIAQLRLELNTLKAKNEEKDIENYRMKEEIAESKQMLEQFITSLNRTQE